MTRRDDALVGMRWREVNVSAERLQYRHLAKNRRAGSLDMRKEYYALGAAEVASGKIDAALMIKAMALSQGDVAKGRATYISLRAEEISSEHSKAKVSAGFAKASTTVANAVSATSSATERVAGAASDLGYLLLISVFALSGAGVGAVAIGGAPGGLLGACLGFAVLAGLRSIWRPAGSVGRTVIAFVSLGFVFLALIVTSESQHGQRAQVRNADIIDPFRQSAETQQSSGDWETISQKWEAEHAVFLTDEWNMQAMQEEIDVLNRSYPAMPSQKMLDLAYANTLQRRRQAQSLEEARLDVVEPLIHSAGQVKDRRPPGFEPNPVSVIHAAPAAQGVNAVTPDESARSYGTPARLPSWQDMRPQTEETTPNSD